MTTLAPVVKRPAAIAQGEAASWWQHVVDLGDKASLYAPLLMMGFLAAGTYWLVRNAPSVPAPAAAPSVKHQVDYYLRNFMVKSYDANGALKSELAGVEGRHYVDTDTMEIDMAKLHNINPAGEVINASGNRAYSNGDGSEVQLVGNAVVVRESQVETASGDVRKTVPRLEFRGEFLHLFLNEERVTSHKPVVLIRGNDRFTGDSFDYNNFDGVANLKGRVRAVLIPRSAEKVTP